MTLNNIITTLQQSGQNSKQKVIDMLTNANNNELKELERDIREKISRRNMYEEKI